MWRRVWVPARKFRHNLSIEPTIKCSMIQIQTTHRNGALPRRLHLLPPRVPRPPRLVHQNPRRRRQRLPPPSQSAPDNPRTRPALRPESQTDRARQHFELVSEPDLQAAQASLLSEIQPEVDGLLSRVEAYLDRMERREKALMARCDLQEGRLSSSAASTSAVRKTPGGEPPAGRVGRCRRYG